jgi:hypothetical protein
MDDFINILTKPLPQDLWIIKGRLEAEGIDCFIKDELTVQSNNLWSNALGGVKLQVSERHFDEALSLLTELGYIEVPSALGDNLITKIDKATSALPLLSYFNILNRLVVMTLLIVCVVTLCVYLLLRPSRTELLTRNNWTVDKIYYLNKLIGPKTTNTLQSMGVTDDLFSLTGNSAEFKTKGYVGLPGINSEAIDGMWRFDGGNIVLKMDTLQTVFNHSYKVELSNDTLVLKSDSTIIIAHSNAPDRL